MLGLSVYRVDGNLPVNRSLIDRLRNFRFALPEDEGRGEVTFRGPRTMRIGDTQVLYVASRESFPDEGKRLIIEDGRIVEQQMRSNARFIRAFFSVSLRTKRSKGSSSCSS